MASRMTEGPFKRARRCMVLSICLLGACVVAQQSEAGDPDKSYFIARTNSAIWTIFLREIQSGKTLSIRANYLSGDAYIAEQLPPGTYRILNFRKYDNQVVLPKVHAQFTVFKDCTNFYGRLDLYEDGSVQPGKAVVSADGVLDTRELKSLGTYVRQLFANQALCVSGEREDFRFEWDAIKQSIEGK